MKRVLVVLVVILLIFPGCSSSRYNAQIAATTLPVWEFTSRLCSGTPLQVSRLVTEQVSCLHDYALNVRQVKDAESAETVVISGGGLEDFLSDLILDAPTIDASREIPLLCGEEAHHAHGHDSYEHHHDLDPHFWLSPDHAITMASNICDGLCARYPEYAAVFGANLENLNTDLEQLRAYGDQVLSDLQCRELVTFHDGFAYFAQAFGLTILEAVEEESGSEASARELIELIETVRGHGLPAIFTEANGSVSAAEIIARETGCKVYALDMAMAGDSYFHAMYHNIDTIREALG